MDRSLDRDLETILLERSLERDLDATGLRDRGGEARVLRLLLLRLRECDLDGERRELLCVSRPDLRGGDAESSRRRRLLGEGLRRLWSLLSLLRLRVRDLQPGSAQAGLA